jgi:hypothetical protein
MANQFIGQISEDAYAPIAKSLDKLQERGIPVEISLNPLSAVFLLIIVLAPVIIFHLMKKK